MSRPAKNIIHIIRIARTLARNDALFPVEMLDIPALTVFTHLVRRRRKGLREGERLARAFEELGPTFIKLGQILSTRSDLIGEEAAYDLSRLRDNLPPFPASVVKEIIKAELGAPVGRLFAEFDETPVAAASIAQVHSAVLHTGEKVAVKILRPKIEEKIARDIELFFWLARLIEKKQPGYAARLRPVEVVQTLADAIKIELDLRMEAAAASELKENFRGWKGFHVPEVHWKYISRRVLVMEWVEGIKIDQRDELIAAGLNPDDILERAANALFKQVFGDGFFHADLHPGNVFINRQGDVVPIDYGITGRLDRQSRLYVAQIIGGFLRRDYMMVARAHFDAGYVPKTKNLEHFAMACRAVGEPVMDLPINEISVARLLGQMFKVAEDFEMIAQPQLLLMQKTMMMAEGVGRSLNPNVNMWKLAEPLVVKWAKENIGVKAQVVSHIKEAKRLSEQLPRLLDLLEIYLEKKAG